MSDMSRRELLGLVAAVPLAAALETTPAAAERALRAAARAVEDAKAGTPFAPKFFTPHELETARVLADLVIPADERSPAASAAGVPEFMDFTLDDRPHLRLPMRGGLAWLDHESRHRFGRDFVGLTHAQQTAILDDIAWPAKARPEMSQGVAFFNLFRDMTASGFFSSKIGVDDLRYRGNTVVMEWKGCPPEALEHLGVSYGQVIEGG